MAFCIFSSSAASSISKTGDVHPDPLLQDGDLHEDDGGVSDGPVPSERGSVKSADRALAVLGSGSAGLYLLAGTTLLGALLIVGTRLIGLGGSEPGAETRVTTPTPTTPTAGEH